jgi:hypothetical protein
VKPRATLGPPSNGAHTAGARDPVLWRQVRDTFGLSAVTIVLVAGLTYAVLRALALALSR